MDWSRITAWGTIRGSHLIHVLHEYVVAEKQTSRLSHFVSRRQKQSNYIMYNSTY